MRIFGLEIKRAPKDVNIPPPKPHCHLDTMAHFHGQVRLARDLLLVYMLWHLLGLIERISFRF